MSIEDWLKGLSVGDRVRVGHHRMRKEDLVFTRIVKANRDSVAIKTGCGSLRWFSRKSGREIGRAQAVQGIIQPAQRLT